jgi:hypothetical protein
MLSDQMAANFDPLTPYVPSPGEYDRMVDRIRDLTAQVVPSDMIAVVISKGDEKLIDLAPVRGWHFPRAASGAYLGYYPELGREAAQHLSNLYESGARYFIVPRTAQWWLFHYEELRAYLDQSTRIHTEEQACTIYALRGPLGHTTFAEPRQSPDGDVIRDLVNRLLPTSAPVTLLSGCQGLHEVDFGERPVRVLRGDELTDIVTGDSLASPGLGFLVAPPSLPDGFPTCGRLVIRQRHLCAIYELGTS